MAQVAPTKTEERKSPGNPLGPSIFSVIRRLGSQKWELPYLANLVTSLALLLTLCLLILLYPTIGLSMQLAQSFLQLIKETFLEMKPKPAVEKIGHGVAITVYGVCLAVVGVVTTPFYLIAYLLEWIGLKIKVT
jgi:hypothetical protein